MVHNAPYHLTSTCLRLAVDGRIETIASDETFWPRMMAGKLGDFRGEYLVACSDSEADWSSWEMHPHGDEIVCLLSGVATLVLERAGVNAEIELAAIGSFAVVPRGTWHTARIHRPGRLLFITFGEGTRHRRASDDGHATTRASR